MISLRFVFRKLSSFKVSFLFSLLLVGGGNFSAAHEIGLALEFGAQLSIISRYPVQAVVTLMPKIDFKNVSVEISNSIGGPRTACRLGALVREQTYTCSVGGTVADDDTGLVIALVGEPAIAQGDHSGDLFFYFTVPNPRYDAVAVRAQRAQLAKENPVTLESSVQSVK